MSSYIKGNLLHVFYKYDASTYKFFAYGQSDSLTVTSNTNEISSKDSGNHPDVEVSSTTWSLSSSMYTTKETLNTALSMANSAKPYTFAFAVAKDESGTSAADGLQPVTGYGSTQTWEIDPSTFVQYGNAIVTNMSVESGVGEVSQVSLDMTGLGALSATEPTGSRLHPYVTA